MKKRKKRKIIPGSSYFFGLGKISSLKTFRSLYIKYNFSTLPPLNQIGTVQVSVLPKFCSVAHLIKLENRKHGGFFWTVSYLYLSAERKKTTCIRIENITGDKVTYMDATMNAGFLKTWQSFCGRLVLVSIMGGWYIFRRELWTSNWLE